MRRGIGYKKDPQGPTLSLNQGAGIKVGNAFQVFKEGGGVLSEEEQEGTNQRETCGTKRLGGISIGGVTIVILICVWDLKECILYI